MHGGDASFTKIENEDGEVTGFDFEGHIPDDVDPINPAALAFDARYSYDDIGASIDPVWMDGDTAMALEEVGVIRLVGTDTDDIPHPVRIVDIDSEMRCATVWLYTIESA